MILPPGSTSIIKHVFIQDSSVTTGAGKTGLAYGNITAYYVRAGGALTVLTLETISTLGTWASSGDNYLGFKLLNDTNAPGVYELHLPNNILATGANQVTIQLRATGAAPCNIEIQLTNVPAQVKAQDNIDFGALQKASLNAATPEVTLANDAITAAKYDESTAFPLKSADTGASQVARTGADGDTLETLSDEIAVADAVADAIKLKTDLIPAAPAAVSDIPTVANILAGVVEGTTTLVQAVRLLLSALTGKSSGIGTATVTVRDIGDTKNRIVATVDASGNRTAVSTRDGT